MLVPENEKFLNVDEDSFEKIKYYMQNSKSKNTQKSYSADWEHFTDWCKKNKRSPLPANAGTVCLYLTELAETHKYSTLKRRISSINQAHRFGKFPLPGQQLEVQALMEGIKAEKGSQQVSKNALMLPLIPDLIKTIDTSSIMGIRDKAIILLGFALASRRSELVAINKEDLEINDFGMDVRIKEANSKTKELIKSVVFTNNNYCPVTAVSAWIEAANIFSGPLFRSIDRHGNIKDRLSDRSVALILKKYISKAGLEESHFSSHSLRSGLSASAAMMGMNDTAIMKQTGHKTMDMVNRYIRTGMRYKNNASVILKELK